MDTIRMRALAGLAASIMQYPGIAVAQSEACVAIEENEARLACYDRAAGRGRATVAAPPPFLTESAPAPAASASSSRLSQHWELDEGHKRGVFRFSEHRRNYLVATYNRSPNVQPYLPFFPLEPEAEGLSKFELAYQLGFKLKLLEKAAGTPVDLWFGYTQRSFWQAENRAASSPFRETNYEPEFMAVVPLQVGHQGGLRLKFLNVGLNHQSNGQASTLSRSWNRVYLQAGAEAGDLSLLLRVWRRVGSIEENPDILRYMGRGDLIASLQKSGHEYTLMGRYSPGSGNGALQVGWAFPLSKNLKGYIQYFTGYGYSLIDYNAYQRVWGLGVQVDFD